MAGRPWILSFGKPKKVMSSEEYAKSAASDTGIPGTYTGNMSEDSKLAWKAKIVGSRSGNHQIEIRTTEPKANLVIVVNGRMRTEIPAKKWVKAHYATPSEVKLSANGPTYYTTALWDRLAQAVDEARVVTALLDTASSSLKAAILKGARNGIHPVDTYNSHPIEETS